MSMYKLRGSREHTCGTLVTRVLQVSILHVKPVWFLCMIFLEHSSDTITCFCNVQKMYKKKQSLSYLVTYNITLLSWWLVGGGGGGGGGGGVGGCTTNPRFGGFCE